MVTANYKQRLDLLNSKKEAKQTSKMRQNRAQKVQILLTVLGGIPLEFSCSQKNAFMRTLYKVKSNSEWTVLFNGDDNTDYNSVTGCYRVEMLHF